MSQYPPDYDPFARPQSTDPAWGAAPSDHRSGQRRRSGAVTAVAVMNYVMGGLGVTCGGCFAILGVMLGTIMTPPDQPQPGFWNDFQEGFRRGFEERAREDFEGGVKDEQLAIAQTILQVVFVVVGILFVLMSLPAFLAGYGVQRRRQWGRILTIVLAVFSGIIAILCLIQLNPVALIYGGYTISTLVILLKEEYAAEFR